jgi:hypothetical protein
MTWLETDTLSNQNISSALAIGAYTATFDGFIVADISADQVAGNGDYVAYITRQINGAGSAYVVLPKTTLTAASGETAIGGQSGIITVRSGDVLTAYLDGLAGDTTTVDTVVRWYDVSPLQPTTAGRTLDVAATGEVGLDFANIKAATAPTTLTNITVPAVTTVSDPVTMGAMNAAGAQDFFTVDSTDLFADAVAGSVVKEIADHATIVGSSIAAAELADTLSGSTLTIHRGDTLGQAFTVASNTGYVTIDLTVKQSKDDDDDDAILKIRLNAPSANDGLLYLNGAAPVAPVVAADGSITVNSATSITVALAARATDDLVPQDGLYYDIQYVFATSVQTVTEGICNITADVTRSIV